MREKSEKPIEESEAAFAVAIVLANILILAVVGGLIWMLQMIITLNDSQFGTMLREVALR
ncbi:MAG: hypothetical protein M3384_02635 [Acidobacteriota bacterium]|nr:hypothetical protein [Acidobacteriota bacterium]